MNRARALRDEQAAWMAFANDLTRVDPARRKEPSVTPEGWSVQTIVVHVTAWLEECTRVLGAMAEGAFDAATDPAEKPGYTEALNAGHAGRGAAMSAPDADLSLAAARGKARAALETLPTVDADAWTWFEESTTRHYAKHLHDLRAWLAGMPSSPRVNEILDAESDAWLALARAFDAIDDGRAEGPDGWSAIDAAYHLGKWLGLGADGIGHNDGWRAGSGIAPEVTVDDLNATFLQESASLDLGRARSLLEDERLRIRIAVASLEQPSPAALQSFVDETTDHYGEHLDGLRALAGGS